jgi:ferredoxin-fold anticodon binding domain-containing protein
MESETENCNEQKIDIKNVTLKAPKINKDTSFWRIFWINVPKRECISDIQKEYSQVIENMAPTSTS